MLTSKQLIHALALLFDDIELTPEETKEVLREAGYDPDEVGERIAAVAREALERVRVQATGEAE